MIGILAVEFLDLPWNRVGFFMRPGAFFEIVSELAIVRDQFQAFVFILYA